MRICIDCKQEKPDKEFGLINGGVFGLKMRCRPCDSTYAYKKPCARCGDLTRRRALLAGGVCHSCFNARTPQTHSPVVAFDKAVIAARIKRNNPPA